MNHRNASVPRRSRERSEARRRQVTVSFSGLDGAGKTRQIDSLIAAVAPDRSAESTWMPFKIWPGSLLNRLPARYRSRLGPRRRPSGGHGSEDQAVDLTTREAEPTSGWRRGTGARAVKRLVWTGVGTGAAVSAALSLRHRSRRSTADLVIFDRYRLDTVVKLQLWYPDVPDAWLAWVVHTLAPAPSVEVVLRVPPDVAYQRKQEQWTLAQLTRQAALYERVLTAWPTVVVVDADQGPDEVAAVVRSHVVTALTGARPAPVGLIRDPR